MASVKKQVRTGRRGAGTKPQKAAKSKVTTPKVIKQGALAVHGANELVVLTGLSGSGKLSALKAFEDLGYYAVDNLPLELIPRFADLVRGSKEIRRAALVVDIREGLRLDEFPTILKSVRKVLP